MTPHRRAGRLLPAALFIAATSLTGCAVTPQEISQEAMSVTASEKVAIVSEDVEPVRGAIDIYEAVARALKYNLDHRVEMAELALRERELDLSHFSLLPGLVANTGYNERDRYDASSSMNIFTREESLATSTSQDKRLHSADISFSWNILDFGLSYVRARQAADKVLIQNELRRKVMLRIIDDTRAAYWRAVSAQRLLARLGKVERMAQEVEHEAQQISTDGESSPITALTYEREVIEIQRTIGEIARELNTAKSQLAALINLAPGRAFSLVDGQRPVPNVPSDAMSDLIHVAVSNRPELREVEYQKRINEHEAHAALLEMLPGLQVMAGSNFDSNSFLYSADWLSWGAKAGWNLLKVFSYPARRDVVEEKDRLLEARSLAVTMAIITQVYVSRVRYAHSIKEYGTAQRYRSVQQSLLAQIRAEAAAGRISRQTLVREELNAVVAEAKLDLQYAALQSAHANLDASIGVDPVGLGVPEGSSVAELAAALRGSRVAGWHARAAD